MIFDLKSGKRRKVVQVVFGMLAFIFFISFVGFGVGSGGGIGGIFDAIGLGGGSSSSSDPQFDQQISDAQDAIAANPKSATGYADLIAAYYGSATSSGVSTDQQTGQVSISDDAHYGPPEGRPGVGRLRGHEARPRRASRRRRPRCRSSSCSTRPAAPPRRSA